jgi:PKD repeat protein
MRRITVVLLTLLTGLAALTAPLGSAQAASYGPGSLVKTVPVSGTPHVLDGRVSTIAEVGNTIILGGTFTQTRNNDSTDVILRSRLVAFDKTTKKISTTFLPNPNGDVEVVLPAPDGKSVYVGGSFSSIAGAAVKNLAQVNIADGSLVSTFNPATVDGRVLDLRLSNNRLWIAGAFTHVAGKAQRALATVNPVTGKFDAYMTQVIAGLHYGGTTTVLKIDINTQGTRLIALGNFDTIGGVKHHQLLMLDLTGTTSTTANWQTAFYETACSKSFNSYMRDLDFAPDGTFFVVSTTGAYGGAGIACDSTARFETDAAGNGVKPSWIDNTGGDTTYAVEVTSSVVYTGGHARWQNNAFAADKAGMGAVSRPGIAALDPLNGLPLSWNPTRDRGVGVFDFLVDDLGLWVASDTTRIGADYLRSRIALLPIGGTTFPGVKTPSLPNDVYNVKINTGGIQRRSYTGSAFAAAQTVPTGGLVTNNVRGAFMLNGYLYIAWSNGTFDRRTFDGTNYGAAEAVDTGSQLTANTDWTSDISTMTGLFYDSGRLYFTKSGSATLYYRLFTPESKVVGAQRLTASANVTGIDFTQVRGMFVADNNLYWSTPSNDLRRLGWAQGAQSGRPVAGTATVVSSSTVDAYNWASPRALFLFQDSAGDGPPKAPVAAYSKSCTSLTCTFDSSGSTAQNATIAGRAWNFGDGTASAEANPVHAFPATGTYQVALTVTSSKGLTNTVTQAVQVTRVNQNPTADFTATCNQLTCAFDAAGSKDPDGTLASYAWNFGDGTTGSGSSVSHPYGTAATRDVTLTVTDNEGGTGTTTKSVKSTQAGATFVAAASTNGNRSSHAVTIPGGVQANDTLLLFLTVNSTNVTVEAPAGWTEVQSGTVDGLQARVWSKSASSTDAGTSVAVATSAAGAPAAAKSDLTVAAYRPTAGSTLSVATSAQATSAAAATQLTTPQVNVTEPSSWLVSYWGAKSSGTVAFSTPAGQQARSGSVGSGSGNISGALTDSGQPVAVGTRGGLTADAGTSTSRAAMYSVVLTAQ